MDLGQQMESVRSLIEHRYRDVEKYVTPWLTPFDDHEGNPPTMEAIYDHTAVNACNTMGNGLTGFTTNPAVPWFILGLFGRWGEPLEASEIPGAAHWLRLVERCIRGVLARSNFYPQAASMAVQAASHGSPTMWCDPPLYDGQPWSFQTQHPKSIWFSENDRKEVDNHRRRFRLQNKDLIRRFGKALGEEHSTYKQWAAAPAAWTTVYHQVYPNDEFDPSSISTTKKKIRSVYMLGDGCILENKGLDFDRYLTWRWQVTSDQTYSTSVAMDIMSGIKTLQQMKKTITEVAQQQAEPTLTAPDDLRGKVRMAPRSIIYTTRDSQRVERLNLSGNFVWTEQAYAAERAIVGEAFHEDLWKMLAQQSAASRMTAFEVSQRIGEKANALGSIIANHNSEFDDHLISMIFNVEMKAGRLPPPPVSIKSMAGSDGKGVKMQPHYIGPLQMAQKRNGVLEGFNTALQAIGPLLQMDQSNADHINFARWLRMAVASSGAPEEVINGMDTVVQIRKGRMEAIKQQQQQAQQQALMQNLKGLNQAPDPGSIGSALNRTLGIPERTAV